MNFVEMHSVPTMCPSFNMYLHVLLFLSWLLLPQPTLVISTTATTITPAVDAITNKTFFVAKPGCNLTCGSLTVPYPFGIGVGSNCSIAWGFDITCNTSSDPPKAFISTGNVEVLSISQTHVRVRNYVARACYNETGALTKPFPAWFYLGDPGAYPYTFSVVVNKFTVVGCDDSAWISGTFRGRKLSRGCMSQCFSSKDVGDETGYCQTDIPKGLTKYNITLRSFNNHTTDQVSSFNPCSYAFLGDKDSFKFYGISDFSDSNFMNRTEHDVPIVLDYAVDRNKTCDEAQNSNTSKCLDNASCNDSDSGYGGYLCSCNKGYKGNPYLSPGCTDINECEDNLNDCDKVNGICQNTPGNYFCYCNPHYYGDGKSCTAKTSQSPVIKFFLGIGLGLGVLLLVICLWFLRLEVNKRKEAKLKEKFFKRNGGLLLKQQLSSDIGNLETTKLFTSKELEKATENYNANRILGQGGQGTVYKGMLTDGRIVAIKKSKVLDEDKLEQFINEVVILSQINHRNVVKLFGCCLETEVPMLVYEFVPNGTLFHYIHDKNEEFPLTWVLRLQIATEIAGALSYLHSAASIAIYHRDIKPTNILLDEKFRAKISDFGISRSISVDKTHLTTAVQGTFGYLDPEYFQSSQFTEKSDVYSFGVVLVELLTGKMPILLGKSHEGGSLTTYFLLTMKENRLFDILDARIVNEGGKEAIWAVASVAKRCLHLNGSGRPTMKEVLIELDGIKMSNGASAAGKQSCQDVEYAIDDELTGPWEAASTSKGSFYSTSVYPTSVV